MDVTLTKAIAQNFQGSDSPTPRIRSATAKSAVAQNSSPAVIPELIKKMEASLNSANIGVSFTKYGNNKTAIVLYDKETSKVIREIPSEEIQNLQRHMEEAGIIFDRTA